MGGALARITGKPLRDTDDDIEAAAGRPISDIFTTDGEPVFRAHGARGGAGGAGRARPGCWRSAAEPILAPDTRAALAGHAVVFLSVTMPPACGAPASPTTGRCSSGSNPRATYKALLEARLPLYRERAVLEVDTDRRSIDEVAALIVEKLGLA